MNWLIRTLPTWQGRLLTGAALVAAAVAATISAMDPRLTAAARIALFIPLIPTLLAWFFATIAGGNSPHPHDIKLFESIIELLTADERDFLRSHDFGNNFQLSHMKGVAEIDHWQGAPYEFLDRILQKQWAHVKAKIRNFHELVALTTAPVHGDAHFQTVYPRLIDPEDPPLKVKLEIRALNDAATSVSESLNAFEPVARRKLFV
jgi:hypothetical protein